VAEGNDIIPSLGAACRVWAKIGLLSFGGPAGQIALMHKEIVDRRAWVGEKRFLQALSFCNLLPGPEAQQLAIYLGWLTHGAAGGLLAGGLFVLPGAAVMLALSLLYVLAGGVPAVDGVFYGLRCAVLALVIEALLRIAKRALKTRAAQIAAGLSFTALFAVHTPFPLVLAVAAIIGWARPVWFSRGGIAMQPIGEGAIDRIFAANPALIKQRERSAQRAGVGALAAWLLPAALIKLVAPKPFADIAWFFSKMSVVTFGGAYAVLAYVAQDAVQFYHWLTPAEMMAGLGLAETTPGPLILVLQFTGFMAGFRAAGIAGATLASLLTLWVTFVPCFAFVFLGAPWIEKLAAERRLAGALAGITAAVSGVIAQLAVWFGLHVLFTRDAAAHVSVLRVDMPVLTSLDPRALGIAVLAGVLVFFLRTGVVPVLLAASCAGLMFRLL
jgi:chromate transporter